MALATVNPTTGERVRSFDEDGPQIVERKVAAAWAAFDRWRRAPVASRAAVVARAGEILQTEKRAFGQLMTLEMGKLIGAGEDEAAKCATACRYYAEHAEAFLKPEV